MGRGRRQRRAVASNRAALAQRQGAHIVEVEAENACSRGTRDETQGRTLPPLRLLHALPAARGGSLPLPRATQSAMACPRQQQQQDAPHMAAREINPNRQAFVLVLPPDSALQPVEEERWDETQC